MLCTITAKLIPVVPPLVLPRLWQNTQYSVWLRFSPCSESLTWHWLHLAVSTTWRRFTTGEPDAQVPLARIADQVLTVLDSGKTPVGGLLLPGSRASFG